MGVRGLEIFHVFADSIVFEQQIYCSFLRMVGVGRVKSLVTFCERHKWITPKNIDGLPNLNLEVYLLEV